MTRKKNFAVSDPCGRHPPAPGPPSSRTAAPRGPGTGVQPPAQGEGSSPRRWRMLCLCFRISFRKAGERWKVAVMEAQEVMLR